MPQYATPADFLANGLRLSPLSYPPEKISGEGNCAITGQPIEQGYRVADMVGEATAEFLDCFRGGMHGYVSEAAARCFKNADPRRGNPTARALLVFADTYYEPLIDREAKTQAAKAAEKAQAQLAALESESANIDTLAKARTAADKARLRVAQIGDRPCWSDLVRSIWPARRGQPTLAILTTDTKKRLWIRARVGTLGSRTPLLCYDSGLCLNEVRWLDWPRFLECLDLIEQTYSLGFPKEVMRDSLYRASKVAGIVGLAATRRLERELAQWREQVEFAPALLIAQKAKEEVCLPLSK